MSNKKSVGFGPGNGNESKYSDDNEKLNPVPQLHNPANYAIRENIRNTQSNTLQNGSHHHFEQAPKVKFGSNDARRGSQDSKHSDDRDDQTGGVRWTANTTTPRGNKNNNSDAGINFGGLQINYNNNNNSNNNNNNNYHNAETHSNPHGNTYLDDDDDDQMDSSPNNSSGFAPLTLIPPSQLAGLNLAAINRAYHDQVEEDEDEDEMMLR